MRVDITTYKEDGSELITRRYDFEEHENDVASDAIQDILDDSRDYLKDKFKNDEELIEQELEEHLTKKEDEAEKIGDDLRQNA